jgi:uncharacterized protein YecE (DUF72 family)
MGLQFDPPNWLSQLGALVTAGGGSVVVVKLIEKAFQRADKQDDVAAGLRGELVRRLEVLEKHQAELEAREREWFQRATNLEAENRGLRQRYHALINWLSEQPNLPTPPKWLYQPVEGPTAEGAMPKPSDPKP